MSAIGPLAVVSLLMVVEFDKADCPLPTQKQTLVFDLCLSGGTAFAVISYDWPYNHVDASPYRSYVVAAD